MKKDTAVHCVVNANICMGARRCIKLAPHYFEMSPAGYARYKGPAEKALPPEDIVKLQAAHESCPTAAISIQIVGEE